MHADGPRIMPLSTELFEQLVSTFRCVAAATSHAAWEHRSQPRLGIRAEAVMIPLVDRMGHGEGKVFERLGMKPMGYFVAAEDPKSQNTFVYILSHESLEKAKENWAKFRDDADWKQIRAKSEAAGPIVAKAEAIFVNPTDFSSLK